MYAETYWGTLNVCVGICRALTHTHTLGESARNVRAVLDSMPWVDRTSRGEVLAEADVLTRSLMSEERDRYGFRLGHRFDGIMKAFNRAYKRRWVATKGRYVVGMMDANRRRSEPIVFYLVSKHQKPQPAHADAQGTVLIDRFWRSALDKAGLESLIPKVAAYVESNGTRTVQASMGAPTWLITRVNCRHFLIPLRTSTVLRKDLRYLNANFQRHPSGIRRPITDPQRYAAYLTLRNAITSRCDAIAARAK